MMDIGDAVRLLIAIIMLAVILLFVHSDIFMESVMANFPGLTNTESGRVVPNTLGGIIMILIILIFFMFAYLLIFNI